MYVCALHMYSTLGSQKGVSGPLESEVIGGVSRHVDVGNQTQ